MRIVYLTCRKKTLPWYSGPEGLDAGSRDTCWGKIGGSRRWPGRRGETIAGLAADLPAALGLALDVGESGSADQALAAAREQLGPIRLVINAIADPAVSGAALANERSEAPGLRPRLGTAIEPVRNVIAAGLRALAPRGHGTLIQITGGLALRARRGTSELAATGYATRALVEGSIAEARDEGVHLALLVIRGLIESDLTASMLEGKPPRAAMTADDVTAAIDFLVAQTPARAWTHELTLTPPEAVWLD